MFEGGISFNRDSDKAIRLVALLGTPFFAGYNLLVMYGIAPSENYTTDTICLIISALWIIVGLYHFFVPIRSHADMFARLVLYQALALATLMFVTGFLEPFASSIALLFLAANIYFGRIALAISISSVVVAGAIDTIVRYPSQPEILAQNILGVLAILILGVAMVGVIIAQETRRKALINSQAQERLQYERILTIMNNLSDAALSTNSKGKILMYNAACLGLLDTNENLNGKDISSFFNLKDGEGNSVKFYDILKDSNVATRRDDLTHSFSDGETIRLEVTYAPIKTSYSHHKKNKTAGQGGYIAIVRDVTKAKSLEEERDEFISVVSHELRTPVTIVEGSLSNLQVMLDHGMNDQKSITGAVNMAHDQVVYLAKMINDLSTLSRAERGVADAGEDIDVTELSHKMFDQYRKEAEARGLKLDLDASAHLGTVHASRLYLEELLQNFITNAIKYTHKGTVTVIVKAKKGEVTFTVKDTGIGISRTDQQKIFQKFYRSEDYRTRETNGTGLGLYVAVKLSKKLGTKIEFSSRINHGSSFGFTLPLVEVESTKQ